MRNLRPILRQKARSPHLREPDCRQNQLPNRLLREGILTSERVAALNWAEEVFYRRLMSVVDDYGRFHANAKLIRAACYPLLIDKVSDADVGKWLANCAEAALVSVYPAPDGKRYLQLLDFRQQVRAEKSKYPEPPNRRAADATQLLSTVAASAHLDGVGVGDVFVTPKPPAGVEGRFEDFWNAYPRKVGKDAARKAFEKRKPDAALLARMLSAIVAQASSPSWTKDGGQFIPHRGHSRGEFRPSELFHPISAYLRADPE